MSGKKRQEAMKGAKRKNFYVDEPTMESLLRFGNGNASAGIREAVRIAGAGQSDHKGSWVINDIEVIEKITDKITGGFDKAGNLYQMDQPSQYRVVAKSEAAQERLKEAVRSAEIVSIEGVSCVVVNFDRDRFLAQEVREIEFPDK